MSNNKEDLLDKLCDTLVWIAIVLVLINVGNFLVIVAALVRALIDLL
jgi:hypothetical protein